MAFKVQSALVCDDIRTENSGKHILVGVYPKGIAVRSFPANLMLCVWVQLEGLSVGEFKLEFRGVLANREIVGGELGVNNPGPGLATIPIGKFPVGFDVDGDLRFDLREVGSKRWKKLITLPVSLHPDLLDRSLP